MKKHLSMEDESKFTIDDLMNCWDGFALSYFIDILNGEYDLEEAKSDLRSLVGSKYDARINNNEIDLTE